MIGLLESRVRRDEDGYTITEMMVVVLILSLLMGVFYAFLFGGDRVATDGRNWVELNQTARLAFERLTRELREADQVLSVSSPSGDRSISFQADFDSSGSFATGTYKPDISPDEVITYSYNGSAGTLSVATQETPTGTATALSENIISFRLLYYGSEPRLDIGCSGTVDPPCAAGDGVIHWQEIDRSPVAGIGGFGNNDGVLNVELQFVTSIVVEMTVGKGGQTHVYRTGVELRNTFQ